jgi:magnesium transporter
VNGLNHITNIERIAEHFQLHPLVIEDVSNTQQRPKMEEYENYIYVVLKMLYFDEKDNLQIEHISFVLGDKFVLSFQEADGDVFNPIRERLRANRGKIRKMGADYLLYSLMDAVVDNYFSLMEVLGEKIEETEEELFDRKPNDDITQDIHFLKREILKIRRAVYPLREVVNRMEKIGSEVIKEKTQLYIRDLHDHIIQVSESIDIHRELIWGLMDMYMSSVSNKMNEVMKVLTIIATVFIPLTFIAGIYGMNFKHMPELDYEYSYYILWGVMALIFIGLLFYFKRRRWI